MNGEDIGELRGLMRGALDGISRIERWCEEHDRAEHTYQDRHGAQHRALDDASRERQVGIEHRVTAAEEKAVASAQKVETVDKRVCAVEKTLRQRTLVGGVLVGIGAAGAWLAQTLGWGKPVP